MTGVLWQFDRLQLSSEVHPLLCCFDVEADVLLPHEVLRDDGTQQRKGLYSVNYSVTKGNESGRFVCSVSGEWASTVPLACWPVIGCKHNQYDWSKLIGRERFVVWANDSGEQCCRITVIVTITSLPQPLNKNRYLHISLGWALWFPQSRNCIIGQYKKSVFKNKISQWCRMDLRDDTERKLGRNQHCGKNRTTHH